MTRRVIIAVIAAATLVSATALRPAWSAPPKQPAADEAPATRDQSSTKAKPKPRRVIIFGTTIVGDVLKPPIDKTIPWQRPAAFRSNAAPLAHDFMTDVLTPLDRDAILRDTGELPH